MIRFTQGNLLDAQVEALVNTVNTVGVMGKGLALMFKQAFPENYEAYRAACERGEVTVGRMFVTENRAQSGPRYLINFPTKKHWRHPSRMEYVTEGLKDLIEVIKSRGIRSVAIPPLGCGLGGLSWPAVKGAIQAAFSDVAEVEVWLYEPTAEHLNKTKGAGSFNPHAVGAQLVERFKVAEGGAWTGAELEHRFGLGATVLNRWRKEHGILYWRDARREFHYPQWQFTATGALLPGLQEVLQTFRSTDEWRLMSYFLSPRQQLDGRRPLDLLRDGEKEKVLAHATHHAKENSW